MKINTTINNVKLCYEILPGGREVIINGFKGNYTNQTKRGVLEELKWSFESVYLLSKNIVNTPVTKRPLGLLVL